MSYPGDDTYGSGETLHSAEVMGIDPAVRHRQIMRYILERNLVDAVMGGAAARLATSEQLTPAASPQVVAHAAVAQNVQGAEYVAKTV